jgi:hypothetical protein
MPADDAARDKRYRAAELEGEAAKQAAQGNLDIAKQLYNEAKAMYADLARSAGSDYLQYSNGLSGVESAGKKYIEILKQEKAEAQSRWDSEQKNVENLKKALEYLTESILELQAGLKSLAGQGEITFKANGLTEIEDRIKAILENNGKQVVIDIVQNTTTTQGKNAGGIVTAFAAGGQVPGGYGTRDTVDAKLTSGEFVIPAGVVKALTPAFFYDLINMKIDTSRLKDMFTNISRPNISIPQIPHYNAGGLVATMGAGGPRETIDLNLNFGGTAVPVMMEKKNVPLIRQIAAEQKRNQKVRG